MTANRKTYTINRTRSRPPLSGATKGTPWEDANVLRVSQYPWYRTGLKQGTAVRLLYDRKALYVQFLCQDRHIFSQVTELNGPVFEDSCVEFFASPDPGSTPSYFNLEVNCCGVFHLGVGPGRGKRRLIFKALASKVLLAASEAGPTRDEALGDKSWWVAAALPFELLSRFTRLDIAPRPGSVWVANFYRCGGKTDDQYACWNPIQSPEPDFHRPECFGVLRFGSSD